MSDRADRLKSMLRGAASAARRGIRELSPVAKVRQAIRDIGERRAIVPGPALNAALAAAPGIASVMARAQDGVVRIDATFDDGRTLTVALRPAGVSFAPHGPKELSFGVDPPELAADTRVQALVLATATAIATTLWAPALRGAEDDAGYAATEREGSVLRVDLRTIPIVRAALRNRAASLLLDAIELSRVLPADGAIQLELRLPGMPGRPPPG